ncbi:DegT/DnrJ/EryC1/StrS family aminotransferase [Streptomyces sp. NEAU-Y11]|uniref:DegT/DnrJ/EryC1/StrS family aminotransferase n=1 Tax=Streptomyces cucumeris TaxID=2962890 RepID=UPI0020C8D01D|nr:aminotransferase class I/II-fold pyridoxal phosphate-dependent enzyme [Streptomyces sp. NEAU-Y11]MCP9211495.1 aminotransferase class I/II-fold pyridoxal phosphate-dependent enzyme [Streptomyces sp. NEAU-Y11]
MSKLAIDGGQPILDRAIAYPWPKQRPEWSERVLRQLKSGQLSIYDRSGVVAEFEDAWSMAHDVPFSLVTNSGTAALHSAFYGVGLGPRDEVLCPSYTFFATSASLFQLGALPVLVDSKPDGSFDVEAAAQLITDRTKAIVITHMWGLPCDMDAIVAFTQRHGLALIEDCSHAHGATYGGRPVGTFGDAAAWSMQTQKLVAAGEGGVMCTSSREVYDRAQLLGHFNKRAMKEMDPEGELYPYSVTGHGLKYRAHPLAIAFAVGQVAELASWVKGKQGFAGEIAELFTRIEGIIPLTLSTGDRISAHYALLFEADPDVIPGGRDWLVAACNAEGLDDLDIPKATSPLHTLHLFQNPISPVTTYDRPCIRARFPVADRLAARTFKISVPCAPAGYEEEDEQYLTAVRAVVEKVANHLSGSAMRGQG